MKDNFYHALHSMWQAYAELNSQHLAARRIEGISFEIVQAEPSYRQWAKTHKVSESLANALWYMVCMMFDQAGLKNSGFNNLLKDYWIQNLMTARFFQASYPEEFLEEQFETICKAQLTEDHPAYWFLSYCLQQNVFDKSGQPLRSRMSVLGNLEKIEQYLQQQEFSAVHHNFTTRQRKNKKMVQLGLAGVLCLCVLLIPLWFESAEQSLVERNHACSLNLGCSLGMWLQNEHYETEMEVIPIETGWHLRLDSSFSFASGQTEPNARLKQFLLKFSQFLKGHTNQVAIIGHADGIGNVAQEKQNKYLAAQRAYQVSLILQDQGIDSAQIFLQSRGAEAPVVDELNASDQLANRRVEFFLYSK